MARKYKVGDVLRVLGKRRTVQRIISAKHGGHCYYGFRMKAETALDLPPNIMNIGFDGIRGRQATRIYWVRSDHLGRISDVAHRVGVGRPQLHNTVGRKRLRHDTRYDLCQFCGTQKLIESKSCLQCKWRLSKNLVCPRCGSRKKHDAHLCRACAHILMVSSQTVEIIEALKQHGDSRGVISHVARHFHLSRARVSQIAKRHQVFP